MEVADDDATAMTQLRTYGGPLVAALVLFGLSGVWAWAYWGRIQERATHLNLGMAAAAAASISPLFDPDVEEALGGEAAVLRLVERRLRLYPPLEFAVVVEGERPLITIGQVPPQVTTPLQLGEADSGRYRVVQVPVRAQPRLPPEFGIPTPEHALNWGWDPVRPPRQLFLVVGIRTVLPARARNRDVPEIFLGLLVAWAAIGVMVLAWVRNIRWYHLAGALDAERRERNRLEEMSLAAAGLAHETKNPLGIILGLAQRIERTAEVPEIRQVAGHIIDAADQAAARIGDFLNFARAPKPQLQVVRGDELLARVANALKPDFEESRVQLTVELAPISIQCTPAMTEQIVVNLLLNSLRASERGTTVALRLEANGATASLVVEDQGCGIPPELMPNLFKPYVSGRADGHGLGLAIVKRIVDQHAWTIEVSRIPSGGTRIAVGAITLVTLPEANT